MSMIRLSRLGKQYGSQWAVQDLDLEIPRGELFGFLGPNGAGKTTTIRMLTGLVRPTRGRVEIDGLDMRTDPVAAKSRIGFVPDHPFVYERLTGREFLAFSGALHGLPLRGRDAELVRMAERFELADRLDELIGGYSHGMRQKLVLTAALQHRPPLLVIDEPMVGLDPKGARTLKAILKQHCSEGGSVFLSTHTLEVAQQLCHRIGIIQQGRLRALGSMEELRETARTGDRSLEEVFLRLTGGAEMEPLLRELEE